MRGRTIVDLSLYKAQIITWFQDENKTAQEIVDLLLESYDTTVALRTVQRRLKDWNITKRTRAENTATLRARIAYMFCILGFTDLEILHALKHEGYRIEMTSLVRIRREQKLWRRLSVFDWVALEEQLREAIKEELNKGSIEGYGKRLLYTHFRTIGFIATQYEILIIQLFLILTFLRASIFNIVKELDPIGLQRCTNDMQCHYEEFIVPSPDYIWSLDGHDKLLDWGIEIYAAIDAYSRFIIWIYVGVSNRTEQSVAVQYNSTIAQTGYHPRILRTNLGKETLLMLEIHFSVARTSELGIKLEECYYYSTSRKNQRIELWWSQLERSCLWRWRVSFIQFVRFSNLFTFLEILPTTI
jgi:hypothetical protein